jgi:hypothetical protein
VRRPEKPRRVWPWRLALPGGAAIAIGTWLALSPPGDWRASANQLQARGLDALRSVATSAAGKPATGPRASAERSATLPAETVGRSEPQPAGAAQPDEAPPPPLHEPHPAAATEPETPAAARPGVAPAAAAAALAPASEPAVLSLSVHRIAAREDHVAVAIDVVRSGDTRNESTVVWWTTPGTAHQDDDYVSSGRQTATLPPGATTARLLIPLVNDNLREPDETFTVHIGDRPHGAVTAGAKTARVTLYDDD